MKTQILLGLLVVGALLAPAATAHVVLLFEDPTTGECTKRTVGSENVGPHPTFFVSPCGPGAHSGPTLP